MTNGQTPVKTLLPATSFVGGNAVHPWDWSWSTVSVSKIIFEARIYMNELCLFKAVLLWFAGTRQLWTINNIYYRVKNVKVFVVLKEAVWVQKQLWYLPVWNHWMDLFMLNLTFTDNYPPFNQHLYSRREANASLSLKEFVKTWVSQWEQKWLWYLSNACFRILVIPHNRTKSK